MDSEAKATYSDSVKMKILKKTSEIFGNFCTESESWIQPEPE